MIFYMLYICGWMIWVVYVCAWVLYVCEWVSMWIEWQQIIILVKHWQYLYIYFPWKCESNDDDGGILWETENIVTWNVCVRLCLCLCKRTCACVWSDDWLWFSGLIMGGNMISVGKKDHFRTASRGQVHMFVWFEVKMIWKNNETKLLKSDKSFCAIAMAMDKAL